MTDCSNHKREIAGIADMKALAEMIGDLHYETLSHLLRHLQEKIWRDSNKDWDGGRTRLGDQLADAAMSIENAHYHIYKAWEISKPFMST